MGNWKYRVDIRKHLTDDESKEAMLTAVTGIENEVKVLPGWFAKELQSILSSMRKAAEADELPWFNASLDRLWDFFDANNIWVEL